MVTSFSDLREQKFLPENRTQILLENQKQNYTSENFNSDIEVHAI